MFRAKHVLLAAQAESRIFSATGFKWNERKKMYTALPLPFPYRRFGVTAPEATFATPVDLLSPSLPLPLPRGILPPGDSFRDPNKNYTGIAQVVVGGIISLSYGDCSGPVMTTLK